MGKTKHVHLSTCFVLFRIIRPNQFGGELKLTNLIFLCVPIDLEVSHLIKNETLLEKAIETEFLAKGGTITFIHDGENITKEFIFPEED